jgi:hypothetical protein
MDAKEFSREAVRFWTCHWQISSWRDDVNSEYAPIISSGSGSFKRRGVSVNDVAYIVSLSDGQLLLGGRMRIRQIVLSRDEAVRILDNDDLYEANEWIISDKQSGTPLNLHRRLAPSLARQLRFLSPQSGEKPLAFVSDSRLDNQATRGVRELTRESAKLLDRIIEFTDRLPKSAQLVSVTEEMLNLGVQPSEDGTPATGDTYLGFEGVSRRVEMDRYERDRRAREECIRHYKAICFICGFDFGKTYGPLMSELIHVHHLTPLSEIGGGHSIDPVRDLRPICPNCHAVIHRRTPPYSLEEVRDLLAAATKV